MAPAERDGDDRPRLGFAGTPDFAAAALRHLCAAGYRPELVLTQPDRPAGRGRKLRASAVKTLARDEGLRIEQPESLKDEKALAGLELDALDCLVVAAYGLLLPQWVLAAPRVGCVNIHASLLPRWRGAAPVVWAIADGDAATGVCLMRMEAGLDTGPVLACRRTPIGARETADDVKHRLAQLGGELLVQHLPAILDDALDAEVQDDDAATYARKLSREDGRIDWQQPAHVVDRRIRAFNPYPGCVAELDGEPLKCWRSVLSDIDVAPDTAPGTIIALDDDGMHVACAEGAVCINEVQRPGKGRITAAELDAQHALTGQKLGNGA